MEAWLISFTWLLWQHLQIGGGHISAEVHTLASDPEGGRMNQGEHREKEGNVKVTLWSYQEHFHWEQIY